MLFARPFGLFKSLAVWLVSLLVVFLSAAVSGSCSEVPPVDGCNATGVSMMTQPAPVFVQISTSHFRKYVEFKENTCWGDCIIPQQIDEGFVKWEARRVQAEIRRMLSHGKVETPERRAEYVDQWMLDEALEAAEEQQRLEGWKFKTQKEVDLEYEDMLKKLPMKQLSNKMEDVIMNALYKFDTDLVEQKRKKLRDKKQKVSAP